LRITTRQAFQFHGIIKGNLRASIQAIDAQALDTIAACGDVNRNVMCTPLPESSRVYAAALEHARHISDHLTPRTGAYREIWLDGKKLSDAQEDEVEPIYGDRYLPRKFKIAMAIPPQNDVDVLAHDLGFIAIERGGRLIGFNVTVGGGMGATHNNPATFPRVADVLGFCTPSQAVAVAEHIVTIQRDFGDRTERKHARFKYTVADRGLEWLRREFAARAGFSLLKPAPFAFDHVGDRYGWQRGDDGQWHVTLYVPAGRLKDGEHRRWMTGMREIARVHTGDFRLTANQNVIVANIAPERRATIEALLESHGLDQWAALTPLALNALACVALPTCSLAMAEAERYLPDLLSKVQGLLDNHGLTQADLVLRITGCPNGCARPYLADIALVGKAPGRYNLFLGGGAAGQRLADLVHENLAEADILTELDGLFGRYAAERLDGEAFSDYLRRERLREAAA
ncbi:MAG: NADPH-dependent assimilatory sulfite reductase hemoprotein subunit, partial [Pseudomonadota bacterium]